MSKKQFLSTTHFLAPPSDSISFSYWNGKPQTKGHLRNWIERSWKGDLNGESSWREGNGPLSQSQPGEPIAPVITPGTSRNNPSGSLRSWSWGSLDEGLTVLQAEAQDESALAKCMAAFPVWGSETRSEMLFFFWIPAGFICGSFKFENPLPFLFWPYFLYLSSCILLSVWLLEQHLTFTTGEQKYSIFLLSQGQAHWDAFVKSEMPHKASRNCSVQPARRVSRGECSFMKCLWTGVFRFGPFFPVSY